MQISAHYAVYDVLIVAGQIAGVRFGMKAIIANSKNQPPSTIIGKRAKMLGNLCFIFSACQVHPRFIFGIRLFRPMIEETSKPIEIECIWDFGSHHSAASAPFFLRTSRRPNTAFKNRPV